MRIIIVADPAAVARAAADLVCATVRARPAAVLGLATGSTSVALYEALVDRHRAGALSLRSVRSFNLDEYVGLSADHPQSYRQFMQRHLFAHTDIHPHHTHLPDGMAPPEAEARRYEALIESAGGIDLQILGIGRNGHIGFNEPTSSLASRTRVKTLTADTLAANARYFAQGAFQPQLAITMGIGTILDARAIVLMATGSAKSAAVQAMVEGPLSAMVPASALQMHPRVSVIVDEAAAADLELADYYRFVEKQRRRLAETR